MTSSNDNTMPPPDDRVPVGYGQPGACTKCGRPLTAHFTTEGRWFGCQASSADAMFILVEVPRAGASAAAAASTGRKRAASTPNPRRFTRGRYFLRVASVTKGRKVEPAKVVAKLDLGDSTHRRQVVAAMLDADPAGKVGVLARDVIAATRLHSGAVTQVLSWLEDHGFVEAQEDGAGTTLGPKS